jgi:hypothetical protein
MSFLVKVDCCRSYTSRVTAITAQRDEATALAGERAGLPRRAPVDRRPGPPRRGIERHCGAHPDACTGRHRLHSPAVEHPVLPFCWRGGCGSGKRHSPG